MHDAAGKKILIVDDNQMLTRMMERAFVKNGYSCMLAFAAEDALVLLEKELPDIILSDYEMPGMNGFVFRQQLLKRADTKHIPFVFLTAYSDTQLELDGLGMQAVDFINKQTPIPVIISRLNNILYSLRQKQALSEEELKRAAQALNVRSVPSTVPEVAGFTIDFWHKSYQGYPGGDFIGVIGNGERYTYIFLGDIMGKKWQAWFFSFGFLSYVRSAVRLCVMDGDLSPARILKKINRVVVQDEALQDTLSSLSLVLIDSETGKVTYSGGGDLPMLFYRAASGEIRQLQSGGLLLGLMEDGGYDEQEVDLSTGDKLVFFSDGMTDFGDERGKHSDYQAFAESLVPYFSSPDAFGELKLRFDGHYVDDVQVDDCSLVFIQKNNH